MYSSQYRLRKKNGIGHQIFKFFPALRRGAPHLQRHQSLRHEDDGLRHRRRDRRASQQTCEAGVGDTGEGYAHPGAEAGADPESADPAAGVAGKVEQESVKQEKKESEPSWKGSKSIVREYNLISKTRQHSCK